MKNYYLALDLKDDLDSIAEYERWHKKVWPEIIESITAAGVTGMEIYRTGNRLFMVMETNDSFCFEDKAERDRNNPTVMKWEELMWNFQQALPWAKEGDKWIMMDCIFNLRVHA